MCIVHTCYLYHSYTKKTKNDYISTFSTSKVLLSSNRTKDGFTQQNVHSGKLHLVFLLAKKKKKSTWLKFPCGIFLLWKRFPAAFSICVAEFYYRPRCNVKCCIKVCNKFQNTKFCRCQILWCF